MSWAIPLAVLVVLVLLAMRKLTLAQRVARLESFFGDVEFQKFAKCWESNFIGLGVVFRMEKTLLQVVEKHNETVLACEVAKKKISEMAASISALTDEAEHYKRQAGRITRLEAEIDVLNGTNASLESSLKSANERCAGYASKILTIRDIANK